MIHDLTSLFSVPKKATRRFLKRGNHSRFWFFILSLNLARGAELGFNNLATQPPAEPPNLEGLPYTVKLGDMRMLVAPSLQLDWNDNVNLAEHHGEEDFILRPTVGLFSSYPLTDRNLLQLNIRFGYEKYFRHDELSSWYVESGSALAFQVWIKDFTLEVHERPSYVQDSAQQPAIAGTGNFGTFNNTVGFTGAWDLNQAQISAGYDHETAISTTSEFSSEDRDSDLANLRFGIATPFKVVAGIEGTADFRRYHENILNNNNSYTAGGFADWNAGNYFTVHARLGYQTYQFDNTSETIQTSDFNSFYGNVELVHQATKALSYSIGAGHETEQGIQADLIEDWYLRSTVEWKLFKALQVNGSVSYMHGKQGVGDVAGNLDEKFDWVSFGAGANYQITERFSLGLNYRLTSRSSNVSSRGYTQNDVGFSLTYQIP